MTLDSIIAQIDAEIARLTQARALLGSAGKVNISAVAGRISAAPAAKARKKRYLSPEARKRIADAQRRRWAAQRAKKAKK